MRFRLVHAHLKRLYSSIYVDSSMAKFYAVAHGFERGIYENWDDAKKQVLYLIVQFDTQEVDEIFYSFDCIGWSQGVSDVVRMLSVKNLLTKYNRK